MRDMAGNFIYICPRCYSEYTVPADVHYTASINLYCEVKPCAYEILIPTQGDGRIYSMIELIEKYGPEIQDGDRFNDAAIHSPSNQGRGL